jgi:hypothetical protein
MDLSDAHCDMIKAALHGGRRQRRKVLTSKFQKDAAYIIAHSSSRENSPPAILHLLRRLFRALAYPSAQTLYPRYRAA